jgi:hypothetical protein
MYHARALKTRVPCPAAWSNCNAWDLCSKGARPESWLGHRLSWLRHFAVFISIRPAHLPSEYLNSPVVAFLVLPLRASQSSPQRALDSCTLCPLGRAAVIITVLPLLYLCLSSSVLPNNYSCRWGYPYVSIIHKLKVLLNFKANSLDVHDVTVTYASLLCSWYRMYCFTGLPHVICIKGNTEQLFRSALIGRLICSRKKICSVICRQLR